MAYYFVGVPASEKNLNNIYEKYYQSKPQVRPQQNFDFSIIDGMAKFKKVYGLSVPAIESYPRSNCLFYKGYDESINKNLTIKYMSVINFTGIKSVCILISTLFWVIKILLDKDEDKVIISGDISFLRSLILVIASKLFKVRVIAVVPDIPSHALNYTKNFKNKILKIPEFFNQFIVDNYDGYVLLTNAMNEILNKKNKPFVVMEGILNSIPNDVNMRKNKEKQYIMYAGTLHKKFGIEKLVKIFNKIDHEDIELWIFGQGDFSSELMTICKLNEKIKYFGSKKKAEIIKYEHKALFLINPRPTNEKYTKFSFPSKTIEYMSSGRPVVSTKLEGIPAEYDKFLLYLDDSTFESFQTSLTMYMNMDKKELDYYGELGKAFVIENKNKYKQAKKIHEFILREIK